MNNNAKNMILVFGEHILFAVLSLFLVYTFSNLLGGHIRIVSVFTALLYISSCYSAGWSLSSKEYSLAKEQQKASNADILEYSSYRGFKLALPNFVFGLVLMLLSLTAKQGWEVAFRFYDYAFIYLITDKSNNLIAFAMLISLILPYIAYSVGYIVGRSKKVFVVKYIPKLFYKRKDK